MRFRKIETGTYLVYWRGNFVGTVYRIRWTSGSATEWKAVGPGLTYVSRGFDTRQSAAEKLASEYAKGQYK